MEQPKRRRRKPAAAAYSKHVSLYETEAGVELLAELAARRGLSIAAFLRTLIREEAKREGVPTQERN